MSQTELASGRIDYVDSRSGCGFIAIGDLDEDWALVHQSIRATIDDAEKRKEIVRSKRATQERIENDYDHGHPLCCKPKGYTGCP